MPRVLVALALALSTCQGSAPADAAPAAAKKEARMATGTVRFETPRGPWLVSVEVAKSDEERQQGLMFRRDLPQDHGMLFLFSEVTEHGFWMHNTFLALDMIFIGEDRAVVGVVDHAKPQTDTLRTVKKPSRYVVEVLAGEAAAHAVGPGTRAVFIGVDE